VLLGRRSQQSAAGLALVAIWFQVVVVFPHICPDDIAGLVAGAGRSEFGAAVMSGALDARDLPLCPLSNGRGGDGCLIYATLHVAGCPLLPDAIKLDAGVQRGSNPALREAPFYLARAHHLLFETRAPPAA
jgi:hypothetical protein